MSASDIEHLAELQYEDALCNEEPWRTTAARQACAPDNAGILLPDEAIDAVAEAFHPRAGHKVEVTRLEEALKLERERVDRVMSQITRGNQEEYDRG